MPISNTTLIAGGAAMAAGFALGLRMRRPAYSFHGRTVVITGGSRGLGLELARELARQGARLALFARDASELARAEGELTAGGAEVLAVSCDVSDASQVAGAIDQVATRFRRLDVVINNAGLMQVAPLANLTREDFDAALGVHLYGPLATTLSALPHMRRIGGGRVVNIASIGGKVAVPHMLPYTASKFALVGLSDGLRAELRRENIRVTTVCPGPMRTGSPRHALFKGKHRHEYAWFSILDATPGLSIHSRSAARAILAACRRGAPRLLLGVPTRLAVLLNEVAPGVAAAGAAAANRLLPSASDRGSVARRGHESESAWTRSFLTKLSRTAAQRNNEIAPAQP